MGRVDRRDRIDNRIGEWPRVLLAVAVAAHLFARQSASAQTLTSTIIVPSDGTVTADFSQPIQWTSVPNVQTYYLYVGTTPGAKDLVDTGETLQTSLLA